MRPIFASPLLLAALAAAACSRAAPPPAPASSTGAPSAAEHAAHHPAPAAAGDSAFAALQARGETAMGVDQYTSSHHFEPLPDGGRIELQRDVDDPAGIARIRSHLREIAAAFGSGDFSTPAFVHMQTVPGTRVMVEKRSLIAYAVNDLPRGGELRMTTRDAEALAAIHEFLVFQRSDHRVVEPKPTGAVRP